MQRTGNPASKNVAPSAFMPSLLDREVGTDDKDAFGHRHYAKALQSLVESPTHSPPYSVGLLGQWGTGKSTIKALYLSSLEQDMIKPSGATRRKERIRPIIFNAWRFGGENIKRALLRHVYLDLGGAEHDLRDELFRQVTRTQRERRSWRDIGREFVERLIWAPFQVLVLVLVAIALIALFGRLLGWNTQQTTTVIAAFILTGVPTAAAVLWKFTPVSLLAPVNRVSLPSTSAEEYEDMLVQQLRKFKEGKSDLGRSGVQCERLVIFVDDLDRLSAEEMVNGLDAIRTFMEISETTLPHDLGIVFVISCDEDRVATALADRRRKGSQDLPGSVLTRGDARRYLDRIFQFRLEIPPFPKQDMRSYALRRLRDELLDVVEAIEAQGVQLEEVVDRMIHVGVQSPRNAVQIVNAFCESWWIAATREHGGVGSDRAGGLQPGAVTRHPEVLAALCALRVDFPDFYSCLQREPELIRYFGDAFIRTQTSGDIPSSVQEILRSYRTADSDKLRPEHWALRQIIASVQELPFPPSLQPLLLLTQDPVARRLGDRDRRLYDTFVSGDTQGVLVALGRDYDTNPLAEGEVRSLKSLLEDIRDETTRRNNGAYVVADLLARLGNPAAEPLLVAVVRRVIESPQLRWRLGLARIRALIERVRGDECREVASVLSSELLKGKDEEIAFRTIGAETPSLDEAVNMARAACSLALWVRDRHSLDATTEARVFAWLAERRVAVGGRETNLPFSDLEGWAAEYEAWLVPALGQRYTALLAAQMEQDGAPLSDMAGMMQHSRSVFDALRVAGQESRDELWRQVGRYLSVREPAAVALGADFLDANGNLPDIPALNAMLVRLTSRLIRDMDGDTWQIDGWRDIADRYMAVVERRRVDLTDEMHAPMSKLAIAWSHDPATDKYAVALGEALRRIDRTALAVVVDEWGDRVLTDLEPLGRQWLAKHWNDALTESQREAVATLLNQLVATSSLDADAGERYRQFVASLPNEAFDAQTMRDHLTTAFTYVGRNYTNLDGYLKPIFPALPPLLRFMDPSVVGSHLQSLFANNRTSPETFAWLFGQMAGYWPSEVSGVYPPAQAFQEGIAFLDRYPTNPGAVPIIESLLDLLTRVSTEASSATDLADAVAATWPTYPDESKAVWERLSVAPSDVKIAGLATASNTLGGDGLAKLSDAWSLLAPMLDDEHRLAVAEDVLATAPQVTATDPDAYLRAWIRAQGGNAATLAERLVLAPDLNDEQRRRVWGQIVRMAGDLGSSFFSRVMPDAFRLADAPATQRAILAERQVIERHYPSREDRHQLGIMIMRVLAVATTTESKQGLAAWLESLGKGVLSGIEQVRELSRDDVEMIGRYLPDSQYISRWLQKRK